jgi:hypothetical protein
MVALVGFVMVALFNVVYLWRATFSQLLARLLGDARYAALEARLVQLYQIVSAPFETGHRPFGGTAFTRVASTAESSAAEEPTTLWWLRDLAARLRTALSIAPADERSARDDADEHEALTEHEEGGERAPPCRTSA